MPQVRGIFFLDYVRMLRRSGAPNLARYLTPEDLELLHQQIDITAWYPMASFERFGLAILGEVVGSELDSVRLWGRSQIPQILSFFPELCAENDPRDTVIRFGNLLHSLFDYPAVRIERVDDESATIAIAYGMGAKAEEAASWQTLGFFEAFVEAAGGQEARGEFVTASWRGDGTTSLALSWKPVRPSPLQAQPQLPRVLLVEDEHLVRDALARLLGGEVQLTCVASGFEALEALEKQPFDALIADLDLGAGATGIELLRQVARRWPECGRVVHAASVTLELREELERGVIQAVAEKPISPVDLRRLLASLRKAKRS